MKIHLIDGTIIKAWKIEPSIKSGYIVVNEEFSIALVDIHCIIPERIKEVK